MTQQHNDTKISETQVTDIRMYVSGHKDFIDRTTKFGSPLQRAKVLLFLEIVGGN